MCKAIQDLQNDARSEGYNDRGREIYNLIQKCRKSGATAAQILRMIEQALNKREPTATSMSLSLALSKIPTGFKHQ